ncbi:NUDIX hydrolase [Micrococcaceae bacterium Sec7.4]
MTTAIPDAATSAEHPIRRIGGRTVLENRFIRVETDDVVFPNGDPGSYSVITSGTGMGVIVIPFANIHGQPHLGLVKQYRYPVKEFTLEFPRGGSKDLSLSEAARELVEETGLVVGSATQLGTIWPDTGILNTEVAVWKTSHDVQGLKLSHVEGETGGSFHWYSHGEIIGLMRQGQIRCGMTLAALALIEGMGALQVPG